jgi:catechol 2,3-dioxygenase-like lactoylglutathione lyase family enzyme
MSVTETHKEATKAATEFECINPILRVSDLEASIEYYVRVLGFKVDWHYEDVIASVSRDQCHIFLCEGDQGNPGSWVWIGVGDAEALFEEYKSKGAKVRNPPGNFPWAYEMQIEDLDGNVLRMGSEPKPGAVDGKWRDMRGDLWERTPEGANRRVSKEGSNLHSLKD